MWFLRNRRNLVTRCVPPSPRRGAIFDHFCTNDALRTIWSRGQKHDRFFDVFVLPNCMPEIEHIGHVTKFLVNFGHVTNVFSQLWSRDLLNEVYRIDPLSFEMIFWTFLY